LIILDVILSAGFSSYFGYTGELTAAELSDNYYSLHNYRQGDRLGRMGAEEVYEDKLKDVMAGTGGD